MCVPSQAHTVAFFYGEAVSCKICEHPKRIDVEKDIMRGLSLRAVADNYTGFSYQSVKTHKEVCIPKAIAASKNGKKIIKMHAIAEVVEEVQEINLVNDLLGLRNTVRGLLDRFHNIEDDLDKIEDPMDASRLAIAKSDMLLRCIDRMVKVLDLYARIQGEVQADQHLHIHNHPDMIATMQKLYKALEPYPKALSAVSELFQGMTA